MENRNIIWNNIETSKPLAFETGEWDGKKSREILVFTKNMKYHIAVMYEGILDGHEFFDFYDQRDFEIQNVTHWAEINFPLTIVTKNQYGK